MSIVALDPRLEPAPSRPHPHVLEGGRSPAMAAVHHRRRVVTAIAGLALFALLSLGVATGFGLLLDPLTGGPGGRPAVPDPAPGSDTVVVQPGDTLWSVARRLQPAGDLRPTVDRLARANGGAQLEVGQVLVLP